MTDRVAVVTGAAHRVGKAIALGLAAQRMSVVVHYHRSGDEARTTAEELSAMGVESITVQADLSASDGADILFDAAVARFGRLDVLVNSAAIMERTDVLSVTAADWDRVLNTNLRGPFLCSQRAARQMMTQDTGGAIVNIADVSALRPWAKYPTHSVSKAGLVMLTEVMAKALAPKIRVNAVVSGPVLKAADWDEERWRKASRNTALKRSGAPQDVVRAVIFLLENDFITGETLVVDGGERLI